MKKKKPLQLANSFTVYWHLFFLEEFFFLWGFLEGLSYGVESLYLQQKKKINLPVSCPLWLVLNNKKETFLYSLVI